MKSLIDVMRILRSPRGCPWDKKQTLDSLTSCLLEETHEIIDAIIAKHYHKVEEELGDLMCIVSMMCVIGGERKHFSAASVLNSAVRKMKHRHPHVFGGAKARTAEAAYTLWNKAKSMEKHARTLRSLLDDLSPVFPALHRAEKIQRRVARVGFDWPTVNGALDKVDEELRELKHEMTHPTQRRRTKIEEELGDLLFAAVNVGRKLNINAEIALKKTNAKFIRRFQQVERILARRGKKPDDVSLAEMDVIWEAIKKKRRKSH